jgi:uncharacterized protein (DUF885 family)
MIDRLYAFRSSMLAIFDVAEVEAGQGCTLARAHRHPKCAIVAQRQPGDSFVNPSKRPLIRRALMFGALAVALGCTGSTEPQTPPAPSFTVDELFADYYDFKLRVNPMEATKLGEVGYNDYIANYIAAEYRADLVEEYDRFLTAIAAFDGVELSEADRLSLGVMKWDCAIKKEGLENPLATVASPIFDLPNFPLMPIAQIFAFHLYFSQLAGGESIQPFETVEDYDNWLERLDDYVVWIDTAVGNMRIGIEQGVVWPRIIVERSIGQIDELITLDIAAHLYYQPIQNLPATIPPPDAERLATAFERVILEQINPAHERLRAFLINDYLPAAGDHSGIGALPNGAETYRYLIRLHTTTTMTADEIHELGLREVDRISTEMESVKESVGFSGDLRSFFDHVRNNEEQKSFTEPEQVIANFEAIHERMKPHLDELFSVEPRAGFEVRRTEAFREASASAEYVPGTKDGSRPGVFYVPIPDVESYNKYADESLFLHEAIPGHHYQLSLQQENQELPEFLHPEGIGVFVEGWALYSESLGRELGLYQDPYQYFGMLSAEMHRAIRLVVDTGMHAQGWTREEAIRYSLDHEAESEAAITAEIERYMVGPGQALSYKIGQLKIRALRARAEEALRDRFDVREFHRQVLDSGSLPLVLLEAKIDRWIAAVR